MEIPTPLMTFTSGLTPCQRQVVCFGIGGFLQGAHNMFVHGVSGSGKSVLVQFLQRIIETQKGQGAARVVNQANMESPASLHEAAVSAEPDPAATWRGERVPDGQLYAQRALLVSELRSEKYVKRCGLQNLLAGVPMIDKMTYDAWNAPILVVSTSSLKKTKAFIAEHPSAKPFITLHLPVVPVDNRDPTLAMDMLASQGAIVDYCTKVYKMVSSAKLV